MPAKTANPLNELMVALIIPSLILVKLSDPDNLGAVNALLPAPALYYLMRAIHTLAGLKPAEALKH